MTTGGRPIANTTRTSTTSTIASTSAQTTTTPPGQTCLPVFYSTDYAAAADAFDTTRKAAWVACSLAERPIPGVVLIEPPLLIPIQIEQVHCGRYVRAVRTGKPRSLAETNGFEWDPGIWTSALASTSGMVTAALYALRRRFVAGSLSSGLHHARRGSGGGFCTFNGLALAARAAIDAGAQRVLILDLDAHAGGGTFSLVRDWPEVWGVDVSITKQVDRYEPRQGDRFQLHIVSDAGAYLSTIRARLEAVGQVGFDLVLYNAGMDPHEDSWGIEGITTETIAERERLVFGWAADRGAPVAFCLAGGYTGARMSQDGLVALHRLTIAAAAQYARRSGRGSRFRSGAGDRRPAWATTTLIPVTVTAAVLTLGEFYSVDQIERQTIEDAVVNMLERYGQAFVDRERETIRRDLAFFAGVWLEDYDDEQEGIDG